MKLNDFIYYLEIKMIKFIRQLQLSNSFLLKWIFNIRKIWYLSCDKFEDFIQNQVKLNFMIRHKYFLLMAVARWLYPLDMGYDYPSISDNFWIFIF